MKKRCAVSLWLGSFLIVSISPAADLKQSKFTQVVNDVRVMSVANSLEKPAAVQDVFNMPDLVRTGAVILKSFTGRSSFPATKSATVPGCINFIGGGNYGYMSGTKTQINAATLM